MLNHPSTVIYFYSQFNQSVEEHYLSDMREIAQLNRRMAQEVNMMAGDKSYYLSERRHLQKQ